MKTTTTNSENKSVLSSNPFWMMNKSLTIIEGVDISLILSHLESTYRYFRQEGVLFDGGIFYQNIPTITQHTGLKRSKIDKALKRLVELEFINKVAGKVPGTMTSTLYFSINTEVIEEWMEANDYKEEVKARKDEFFDKKALEPSVLSKLRLKCRKKAKHVQEEVIDTTKVKPTLTKNEVVITETPDEVENFNDLDYTEMVTYVMNYINLAKGTTYKASERDTQNIIDGLEFYGGWYSTGDMSDGLQIQIDTRMERSTEEGVSYYVMSNDKRARA